MSEITPQQRLAFLAKMRERQACRLVEGRVQWWNPERMEWDVKELEPGPELDRLVAEAIGVKYTIYSDTVHLVRKDPDDYEPHLPVGDYFPRTEQAWFPSTNWADAMEAAERCGLFDGRYLTLDGDWYIIDANSIDGDHKTVASAHTGPHAISLALLKIHDDTP